MVKVFWGALMTNNTHKKLLVSYTREDYPKGILYQRKQIESNKLDPNTHMTRPQLGWGREDKEFL